LGPNGAWFELIDDKLLFIAVVVEDSDTFSLKPNYSPFSLTFSIVLGWVNYTQAIATTGEDNLIFFLDKFLTYMIKSYKSIQCDVREERRSRRKMIHCMWDRDVVELVTFNCCLSFCSHKKWAFDHRIGLCSPVHIYISLSKNYCSIKKSECNVCLRKYMVAYGIVANIESGGIPFRWFKSWFPRNFKVFSIFFRFFTPEIP